MTTIRTKIGRTAEIATAHAYLATAMGCVDDARRNLDYTDVEVGDELWEAYEILDKLMIKLREEMCKEGGRMTEYKAIVKMKIPEVQFHASDDLTQDELETEVFGAMLETASARLGKKESECSVEELLSELYDIQIERVKE